VMQAISQPSGPKSRRSGPESVETAETIHASVGIGSEQNLPSPSASQSARTDGERKRKPVPRTTDGSRKKTRRARSQAKGGTTEAGHAEG
jgi:hypothetical protein